MRRVICGAGMVLLLANNVHFYCVETPLMEFLRIVKIIFINVRFITKLGILKWKGENTLGFMYVRVG